MDGKERETKVRCASLRNIGEGSGGFGMQGRREKRRTETLGGGRGNVLAVQGMSRGGEVLVAESKARQV